MKHCPTCTCDKPPEPIIVNIDAPHYPLVALIDQIRWGNRWMPDLEESKP